MLVNKYPAVYCLLMLVYSAYCKKKYCWFNLKNVVIWLPLF